MGDVYSATRKCFWKRSWPYIVVQLRNCLAILGAAILGARLAALHSEAEGVHQPATGRPSLTGAQASLPQSQRAPQAAPTRLPQSQRAPQAAPTRLPQSQQAPQAAPTQRAVRIYCARHGAWVGDPKACK